MFNEKLVKALEIEQDKLLELMEKNLKKGDYGTYKNLIRALTDVVTLIQREYDRQPREDILLKKALMEFKNNGYIEQDTFDSILNTNNKELILLLSDNSLFEKKIEDILKSKEEDDDCPSISQAIFKFNNKDTIAIGTYKFLSEYQKNLEKYGKVDLVESHSINDK